MKSEKLYINAKRLNRLDLYEKWGAAIRRANDAVAAEVELQIMSGVFPCNLCQMYVEVALLCDKEDICKPCHKARTTIKSPKRSIKDKKLAAAYLQSATPYWEDFFTSEEVLFLYMRGD